MGCPHLHRSLIPSVINSVPSGQNTVLRPLYSDQSHPNTSRRYGKQVPHPPTFEYTPYRGKQLGFPPDSPHCTQHACRDIPKQGTGAGSATHEEALFWACQDWLAARLCRGGLALLPLLVAMPIQQEKGNMRISFSAKLPFAVSSFIRNLVQLLKSQLEKALANLI